ncbi:MAG TPA: hypothetical protein VIH75_18065 [Candidatus Sulfotelmatobacter sp.]
MKNTFRTPALLSLGSFALLFAASTPAQDPARVTSVDQIINRNHRQKVSSEPSSDANKTLSPHEQTLMADATESCSYKFTSGSGATYMNYCVTVNGNFANFQSPAGVEMLDQHHAWEGYGVCDLGTNVEYWDYGYASSGNWKAPVKVKETPTEIEIERSTSDGLYLLTQTITELPGASPEARIVMVLKNTSGTEKTAILSRFAGFLPDKGASGSNLNENYDGSEDSAWGYIPANATYTTPSTPYGLMLNSIGAPAPASTFAFSLGFAYGSQYGPDPCLPTTQDTQGTHLFPGMVINDYGAGAYAYGLILNKNQTSTVTLRYLPF